MTSQKKQKKFNEYLKHIIDCESYGNITKREAVEKLQLLWEQLSKLIKATSYISSKKVYTELLGDIEELLKQYKADLTTLYEDSIKDISLYESVWLQDFFKSIGIAIVVPKTITSTFKMSPIANTTDYTSVINNSVDKIRQSVKSSIQTAYLTQEDTSVVANRFESREAKFEKFAEEDTKALNTTVFSLTNYLIYKANKRKVVYCSILDSKTCTECAMLNGKEYAFDEAPVLPQHYRCRCSLVDSEIVEDMPESFEQWFESLSENDKEDVIGPRRYKLYKDYRLKVTQFVDNQNKLINLKDFTSTLTEKNTTN